MMQIPEHYNAKEVIARLNAVQFEEYEYEEFVVVLKNRLRKFTGLDEVMFYTDEMIVEKLIELEIVSIK